MLRKISAFFLDADSHWCAQLECGHNQHVRHQPPLISRPWVLTEEGRRQYLGTELNCLKCENLDSEPELSN